MGSVYTLDPNNANAKLNGDKNSSSNVYRITNTDSDGNEKSAIDDSTLAFDIGSSATEEGKLVENPNFIGPVLGERSKNTVVKSDDMLGDSTLTEIMEKLHDALNIDDSRMTHEKIFKRSTTNYNRFKVALSGSDPLRAGYPHVFFVRPSCNIRLTSNTEFIDTSFLSNEIFSYAANNCPDVIKELIASSKAHDFMLSLSNAVNSFSLANEYINYDTYGKTYTGLNYVLFCC